MCGASKTLGCRRLVVASLCSLSLATGAAAQVPGLVPLTDMGPGTYLGFSGGLYENGTHFPPADHRAVGLARARALRPLDASGVPSAGGKIVLVSLGMSNTTQEFCSQNGLTPCSAWTFVGQALNDAAVNHTTLALVNGARGGQTAPTWDSPTDPNYNRVRDVDLANSGLTEAQVQLAWVKVANAGPNTSLPAANADAYTLQTQLGTSFARSRSVIRTSSSCSSRAASTPATRRRC